MTSRSAGEYSQSPTDTKAPAAAELPVLHATVRASRLRRGQWEAEVELDPAQLAGLAGLSERAGVHDGPACATALAQRPYASGERVDLRLDPTRTARL